VASIHRRHKSPYWVCEYRSADGRWLKKSTKLRDKKSALDWCVTLQGAEDLISRGSASESQMRQIIAESASRISGRDIGMPTVREWLQQWLDAKAGANAETTLKKYKQAVDDFLAFLGSKADGRLESVTQRDVIDFRLSLRNDGKSPSTVNQLIAKIVSAPFRQAFTQGLLRHNPTAGLPKLADAGKKRKQAFSHEQVKLLLGVTDGDWHGAILAGYTTAMRLGDVTNLQEEQIDYDNDVIAFHQGKTQETDEDATVIGLHPDFRAWLESRRIRALSGPVFPSLAGRASSGKSGLSMKFGRIMAKADIVSTVIREKSGKGRSVHALSFHSFRHSAASAVFKGKVIEQAQKAVTGHKRGQTLKIYTHVDLEAVKAATSMIPRLGGPS